MQVGICTNYQWVKGQTIPSMTDFRSQSIDSLLDLAHRDWTPGTFKNNYRSKSNFVSADVIGLDIDNGMNIAEAVEIFREYSAVIYATKSHQKDKNGLVCDRFRVVIELEQTIHCGNDYTATVKDFCEKLNIPNDDKTVDCSRLFYKGQAGGYVALMGGDKKVGVVKGSEIKADVKLKVVRPVASGSSDIQVSSSIFPNVPSQAMPELNDNELEIFQKLRQWSPLRTGVKQRNMLIWCHKFIANTTLTDEQIVAILASNDLGENKIETEYFHALKSAREYQAEQREQLRLARIERFKLKEIC